MTALNKRNTLKFQRKQLNETKAIRLNFNATNWRQQKQYAWISFTSSSQALKLWNMI